MTRRVARWAVGGLGVGLLPLALAYGIRFYYLSRPPTLRELVAGGEALLVAVSWLSLALLELWDTPRGRALRSGIASVAWTLLSFAWVAYACLTADLVTGRVHAGAQAHYMTVFSMSLLGLAAVVSTAAVAVATPARKEEPPLWP